MRVLNAEREFWMSIAAGKEINNHQPHGAISRGIEYRWGEYPRGFESYQRAAAQDLHQSRNRTIRKPLVQ